MPLDPTPELTSRVFEKVEIGGKSDCWMWTGSTTGNGYGDISLHNGGSELVHRYVMKLHEGDLSDSQVNHKCDTRKCVNPTHLYLGSQRDNMDDAVERDRFPTGDDHHATKLNEESVREIRDKHSNGKSMNALGREYGVDPKTISDIVKRNSWKWVQ